MEVKEKQSKLIGRKADFAKIFSDVYNPAKVHIAGAGNGNQQVKHSCFCIMEMCINGGRCNSVKWILQKENALCKRQKENKKAL